MIIKFTTQTIENKISIYFKDIIFFKVKPFLLKYTYTANTLRTINFLFAERNMKSDVNLLKENIMIGKIIIF